MEEKYLVENELDKIHHERNRFAYFTNILGLSVSLIFQRDELPLDFRWIIVLSLMVLGTGLRVYFGEFFFDRKRKENLLYKWISLSAYVSLGLAWGIHFSDIYTHYGHDSFNTLFTLFLIGIYFTSSGTSLLADKSSYYCYATSLAFPVVATIILSPAEDSSFIVLFICIFLLFSISQYRLGHNQLHDLLDAKLASISEKNSLKRIINTVPGFVGLFDKDLICYMANKSTLNLYPEILGSKLGTIDPASEWEKYILNFMKSDKVTDVTEAHTVKDGKDIHALMTITKNSDGGAIVVSLITNELVEAKKKIRDQEARAQYSAKLASLGEMAAGIAHEVNNPLTIIVGSANVMKKVLETEPVDKVFLEEMADKVLQTSERISKTVKSLKTLSRNSASDPMTKTSFVRVFDISLELCRPRFVQNNIELIVPEFKKDIVFMGREVQISQVMVNLLINAMDAVKGTSKPWVNVDVEVTDDFLNVMIVDSGPGIPQELRHRIMEPFFTTKDVNRGTGLGLSISKTIMEDHGGELTLLENKPHTTFLIRLPRKMHPAGGKLSALG